MEKTQKVYEMIYKKHKHRKNIYIEEIYIKRKYERDIYMIGYINIKKCIYKGIYIEKNILEKAIHNKNIYIKKIYIWKRYIYGADIIYIEKYKVEINILREIQIQRNIKFVTKKSILYIYYNKYSKYMSWYYKWKNIVLYLCIFFYIT